MKAPDFTLPYYNQTTKLFQLSHFKGNIVILTFWASWCADCSNDLPKKEQFYQSIDHTNIKMVTINVLGRERSYEEAARYIDTFLTQPTLIDNGREVYDLYQCNGVPTTVIINQNGQVHEIFDDKSTMLEIVASVGKIVH